MVFKAFTLAATLVAGVAQAADTYQVKPNETLWSLARRVNAEERAGTTAQMAWALYQANPEAFEGSPGRLKAGATLNAPDKQSVRATPNAQAHALLTGKAQDTVAAAPAPSDQPSASGTPPAIQGMELLPAMPGEARQSLALAGTGFAPGATLEFMDLKAKRRMAGRKPSSTTATRIEYAARLPAQTARWQVRVRNPDGAMSAPYEFDAGRNVTLVLAAPTAVPAPEVAVAETPPVLTPAELAATAPGTPVEFEKTAEHEKALGMVKAGERADAVYKFLAPLEEHHAGDVEFDYLLGTAAFDSGRFSEAIFVLQRAVSTRPGFAGARMELARSYYALGDNESARREFLILEKEDPPPEARRVIGEYLAAIDQRAVVYEPQYGTFVELATGFDTNANGAPDTQTFLGFTLDSRNQSTDSSYFGLGLGAAGSVPLGPDWRVLGSGQAGWRSNPDASFVDSQVARLTGGVEWTPGKVMVSALPGYTYAMLDGNENHTNLGIDSAVSYPFEDGRLSVNVRYGQQRYTEQLSIQDVDALIYGFATQMAFTTFPRLQFTAALTAGTEEAVETLSPFGRDIAGARMAFTLDFGRGHTVLLGAATLESDYDGLFFGQPRSDDQVSASAGYEWSRWRSLGWTAGLRVSYVDNGSSVQLYDYDRIDAGISVRKEFK